MGVGGDRVDDTGDLTDLAIGADTGRGTAEIQTSSEWAKRQQRRDRNADEDEPFDAHGDPSEGENGGDESTDGERCEKERAGDREFADAEERGSDQPDPTPFLR